MMKKYFIGDDLLDFTGIPSQESSSRLDTDRPATEEEMPQPHFRREKKSVGSYTQPT